MNRKLLFFSLSALFFLPTGAEAGRTVTLRIDGTDSLCTSYTPSADGATSVLSCAQTTPPVGAPTNCNATINNSTSAALTSSGGSVALSVSCTQTGGVTYSWTKNNVSAINTNRQWSDSLAANGTANVVNYAYQVTACISTSCVTVPTSPLTATVAGTSGGGGGGGWSGTCPGATNTYVVVTPWIPGISTPRIIQPMTSTDVLVVQFTTPSQTIFSNLPHIGVAEYNSPPSSRQGALSPTPCDFSTQPAWAANVGPSNSMSVYFAVGTTQGIYQGYYAQLKTNTTYFFNIKNIPGSSCSVQDICQVSIDLLHPGN